MTTEAPKVRVGVGAFILKSEQEDNKNPRFLVGKRKGAHGAGTFALPGGHLEFGESPEECAAREMLEETGLAVKNVRFLTATNDYMPADNKHYVTIFMVSEREDASAEAEILEPDKCEGWEWWSWEELTSYVEKQNEAQDVNKLEKKLFIPFLNLMKQRPGLLPTN
jgi:8-oxo-dGTP diphosphatase